MTRVQPHHPPRWAAALACLCLALACAAGCGGRLRMPNFCQPGPTGPQRYDAILHDPYPLDDVAPEIVGGRPREYQRPVPEVTRGRLFQPPPGAAY